MFPSNLDPFFNLRNSSAAHVRRALIKIAKINCNAPRRANRRAPLRTGFHDRAATNFRRLLFRCT